MKVVLFGATGMIGSGALIECLAHPDVEAVLVVGRRSCGVEHDKLTELTPADMFGLASLTHSLRGYDACFFCLGVSSAGMTESAYHKITYDLTLVAAETLLNLNPGMTFCYISGTGADSSEKGRVMWARVRGKVENKLLGMPFRGMWIVRPGYVHPAKGVMSNFRLYRVVYAILGPIFPMLNRLLPAFVTTTERIGLALIRLARQGTDKPVLENREVNALAAAEGATQPT